MMSAAARRDRRGASAALRPPGDDAHVQGFHKLQWVEGRTTVAITVEWLPHSHVWLYDDRKTTMTAVAAGLRGWTYVGRVEAP